MANVSRKCDKAMFICRQMVLRVIVVLLQATCVTYNNFIRLANC